MAAIKGSGRKISAPFSHYVYDYLYYHATIMTKIPLLFEVIRRGVKVEKISGENSTQTFLRFLFIVFFFMMSLSKSKQDPDVTFSVKSSCSSNLSWSGRYFKFVRNNELSRVGNSNYDQLIYLCFR